MIDDYNRVQEQIDNFFTVEIMELLHTLKEPRNEIEDISDLSSQNTPIISQKSVIAWAKIKKQLMVYVSQHNDDSIKHGILNKITVLIK
ncbi:MAG: hypothetical protein AAF846_10760 [Chloroflexota bacterium]